MIQLGGKSFELKYDNKNGWNFEAFRDRYSDVLDRYDYIVGDWGYNQLRLKGFFREGNPKGSKESSITSLQDYIQEYCNFGCAYFVLERIPGKKRSDHPAGGQDAQQPEKNRKQQQEAAVKGQAKQRTDNENPLPSSQSPNNEHGRSNDSHELSDHSTKAKSADKPSGGRNSKPNRKRSSFRQDQRRQARSKNERNNSQNA